MFLASKDRRVQFAHAEPIIQNILFSFRERRDIRRNIFKHGDETLCLSMAAFVILPQRHMYQINIFASRKIFLNLIEQDSDRPR